MSFARRTKCDDRRNSFCPEGWLIMPTDLSVALERKRKATLAQKQSEITIELVWVIVSLGMLVLLFADVSFSTATKGWECLLAP